MGSLPPCFCLAAVLPHPSGSCSRACSSGGPLLAMTAISPGCLSAGFASALEMQVEALSDRLHFAQAQRISAAANEDLRQQQRLQHQQEHHQQQAAVAAGSSAAEAEHLRLQLAQVLQQNSALKATAARLSRALAAVIQRSAAAGSGSGRGGRKGPAGGPPLLDAAAAAAAGAAAVDVLAQLSAVERLLAGIP